MRNSESFSEYYNKHANEYFARRMNNGGMLFNELIEVPAILKIFNELQVVSNGNLLDIGCAFGFYSKMFAKMGYEVSAIDVSEQMISIAQNYCKGINNIEFHLANFLDFDFKEKKFDFVLGCFMLGYFDNLELFFNKIKHITKGNSTIVLSMLHPIVQNKVGKTENGYFINNYFAKGRFESNFLSNDNLIKLYKWGYSDVLNACKMNDLYVQAIIEPTPKESSHLTNEQLDFYSRLPSISIFLIKQLKV